MFQHQQIWLPDGEKHFPEWMSKNGEIVDGRGTYQIRKWRACIPHIRQWRCAIDVGAHVGFWSHQMAKRFEQVHAFEPVETFRECWMRNVEGVAATSWPKDLPAGARGALLYPVALGKERGTGCVSVNHADTGGSHVAEEGEPVLIHTLDEYKIPNVDFIKIDCEGYEHHVIEGGRATLIRWRPCVIVEQKPHKLGQNFGIKGTPAVDLLRELGAEVREVLSGDYIMTWPA